MLVEDLSLLGIKLITPKVIRDERGFFFESFSAIKYLDMGIDVSFVQDNVSFSKKQTVRGLHYQSKPGQAKLVSCIQGKILDVAVDIRPESTTFGKWVGVILDDQEHHQLFIPVGFAHGYCVLSETARVHYKVSSFYVPKEERSIRWNDPDIGIQWPVSDPVLSDRDKESPFFTAIEL